MLILICASVLAAASAIPTPQLLTPAGALTAIPATNHILILTPQAQVQLEPSLKYPQPIVQHLAPVARIDSPTDQTVVYYPNENLINNAFQKAEIKPKQLESANLTNIVNQFVTAGQTAQAQLEAFQQQLTQGLETLIQPAGQKLEGDKDTPLEGANKLIESARHEGGRFYSLPAGPQFYSNFELIHAPVNPLFAVHPYTAVRARNIVLPDEKLPENPASVALESAGESKLQSEIADIKPEAQKNIIPIENAGETRSIEAAKAPEEQSQAESLNAQDLPAQKESEVAADNSRLGKCMESTEKDAVLPEKEDPKKEDLKKEESKKEEGELASFAEALPSGLAISGEGGLSQAKPIGSAIVGKDGVAFSAPSGIAIAGSSEIKDN